MTATRWRLVGLLISVGAVLLLLGTFDVAEAGRQLLRADPAPLVAVLGIIAVQMTLRAIRWQRLLPSHAERPVPLRRLAPVMLVG